MKKVVFLFLFFQLFYQIQSQSVIFVNQKAIGVNNGSTWEDAFTDLQFALAKAKTGDTIWLAKGIYKPTEGIDRNARFNFPSGVSLLGGFAGNETLPSQRTIEQNPSVLDGDIGAIGDSSDNCYTIIYLEIAEHGTTLDGLIFQNGCANAPSLQGNLPENCGGAVFMSVPANQDGFPVFRNCQFKHNHASANGGAFFCKGASFSNVSPQFFYCQFENNSAQKIGGAVFKSGGSWEEIELDFLDCIFENNRAEKDAGAVYLANLIGTDALFLKQCNFFKNSAGEGTTAALKIETSRIPGSKYKIDGCQFEENKGTGTFFVSNLGLGDVDSVVVTNSQFINNKKKVGVGTTASLMSVGDVGTYFDLSKMTTCIVNSCNFIWNEQNNIDCYGIEQCQIYFHGCKIISQVISSSIVSDDFVNITANTIESKIIMLNSRSRYKQAIISNNIFKFIQSDSFTIDISRKIVFVNNSFNSPKDVTPKNLYFNWNNTFPSQLWLLNNVFNILSSSLGLGQTFSSSSAYISNNFYSNVLNAAPPTNPAIKEFKDNLVNIEPYFINPDSGDWHLQPCSPLINKGRTTAVTGIPTDFDGKPRVQGKAVDIGVYESSPMNSVGQAASTPSCPNGKSGAVNFKLENTCPPIQFSWQNDSGQTGLDTSNLQAGQYIFTLTDSKNDTILAQVEVPQGNPPQLLVQTQPIICGDTLGGSATLAGQGHPPFKFVWMDGDTTSQRQNLPQGNYSVQFTDAKGCTASTSLEIEKIGNLGAKISVSEITCFDSQDGELTVQPENGKPPFQWNWNTLDSTSTISQLGEGNYLGTLTDVFGCQISWTLPLEAPDSLQVEVEITHATDSLLSNGKIEITKIAGGWQPYYVNWSNQANGLTINDLKHGFYTATLTDSRGCEKVYVFPVGVSTGILDDFDNIDRLRIFPNPAVSKIGFSYPVGVETGVICDVLGRVLGRFSVLSSSGFSEIDVAQLPAGNYFLYLFRDSGKQVVAAGKFFK